jgi:MHS family alpha-ketoglutarate permease-like MFS transporter
MLEWFDWTLYGIFSTYLAANFFDSSNPTSALLSTMAVFAGGFIARPVGGFFFGRLGDRVGRRLTLLVTMMTLSFTTLAIALVPTYEHIGAWASVILLMLRLLQGLAHGGEAGVSYTYVAEIAPKERRGLWTSVVYVSVMIGVMGATGIAALLSNFLGSAAMNEWGWRIGFGFGSLLALYVLVLRRFTKETDVFTKQHQKAPGSQISPADRAKIYKACVYIFLLSACTNVVYYTWVTFAPVNAITLKGMDPSGAYLASLLAQLMVLFFLVLFGHLSDKVGRRPMTMALGIAVILLIVPIQMILTDQPWTLFVAQGLGLTAWALAIGFYPALMAELAPTFARARVVGVMTSLAAGVFGGTAPYLYTWLTSVGLASIFYAYLASLALLTIIVGYKMKETKGMDLNEGLSEPALPAQPDQSSETVSNHRQS